MPSSQLEEIMKAAVYEGPNDVNVEDVPVDIQWTSQMTI